MIAQAARRGDRRIVRSTLHRTTEKPALGRIRHPIGRLERQTQAVGRSQFVSIRRNLTHSVDTGSTFTSCYASAEPMYRNRIAPLLKRHRRSRATIALLCHALDAGSLTLQDEVLVIAAGPFERALFCELGFQNVTYSNVADDEVPVDARCLPFPDASYDLVFVEAALHHLDRPHSAIYEMVRVSRRSVVICETQQHWLQDLMIKLGVGEEYEISAVADHGGASGGVNNTGIPNHVYRWAPGELLKVFRSLEPARTIDANVEYAWDLHGKGGIAGKIACSVGHRVLPRLGNCFALHFNKARSKIQPWLTEEHGFPTLAHSRST